MRKLIVVVLLAGVFASGWWVWSVASEDDPKAVTPTVRDDGSYRRGTLPVTEDEKAVAAAVATLPVALSYDYRNLDDGVDAATKGMTEKFAAEFTETFDKTTRPLATEKQAITSALVRGAGLSDSGDGKATVLVYLDQVLVASTEKKSNDPLKVSQNRVHVDLRKIGDRWLVDDIRPF